MLISSQSDEHTTWTRSLWSSVGEMWSSSGSSWGLKEDSSIKTCPQSRFGLNIETIQDFFATSKFLNFNKVLNALPRTIQFPIRLSIGPWTIMRVRSGFSRWGRKKLIFEWSPTERQIYLHLLFLRVPHRMQLQIARILEWILCRMIFGDNDHFFTVQHEEFFWLDIDGDFSAFWIFHP